MIKGNIAEGKKCQGGLTPLPRRPSNGEQEKCSQKAGKEQSSVDKVKRREGEATEETTKKGV